MSRQPLPGKWVPAQPEITGKPIKPRHSRRGTPARQPSPLPPASSSVSVSSNGEIVFGPSGGPTMEIPESPAQAAYRAYLASPRWRSIRWARLRLDGGRCRLCGSPERLEIHHRSYENKGRRGPLGWLAELRDCITLCRTHHSQYHILYRTAKAGKG
jgi:5-methylcytosine-specific restriction endonuclease McrA